MSGSDQHLTARAHGRSVELCKSMRRLPPSPRCNSEAMAKIKTTPWQPKITEPREAKPRRRYMTWAVLSQHGFSPNCRILAGEYGAPDSCRLPFENIWDKEEARERRAVAGELGRPAGGVGPAAGDATSARQPPASPRRRRQLHQQRRMQRPLHQQRGVHSPTRRRRSPSPRRNQDEISTCT